ncbi:MAG: hypothetical protein R3B95_11565 [Nitrospirales bacterium]|nr:hypothetical protein [Nitrospirales bacterium]
MLAALINPHVKRRVKPEDFLPKSKRKKLAVSPQEREQQLSAALGDGRTPREEMKVKAEPLKAFIDKRKEKRK